MSRFTKIPLDTFQTLQINAGILLSEFNALTGAYSESNILGATSGGLNFSDTPTFSDFAEDIDNAPKNMKEFKHIDDREVKMSGTFVAIRATTAQKLIPSSMSGDQDQTIITPKKDISTGDFMPYIWLVGDYSDKNGALSGGFIAIKMYNALSTGGFSMQTGDKAKGQFAFTFEGHYSIEAQDTVPYEVYIQNGGDEPGTFTITSAIVEGESDSTQITPSRSAGTGNHFVKNVGSHLRVPNVGEVILGGGFTTWNGTDSMQAQNGDEVVVAILDATNICQAAAKTIAVVEEEQ